VLANMLCLAFLAHYNALNYYNELEDATLTRFLRAISIGYSVAIGVFICMMIVGYQLFGSAVQPLILNNFPRTQDTLATIARFATGLAIIFAYPLMFAGVRAALKSLLTKSVSDGGSSDERDVTANRQMYKLKFNVSMTALMTFITAVAIKCSEDDVSFVLGVLGSAIGCTVAYTLPGILSLRNAYSREKMGLTNNRWESYYSLGLITIGILFGILGVWITMSSYNSN
jgi:amino acid permease